MTALFEGTSGYSYAEWVGPFYPEDVPKSQWLSYYASKLRAVEINNTFYQVPRESVVAGWTAAVPESFRFAVKANRRITHLTRLKESADEPLRFLWQAAQKLEARRGPMLFQLPPTMRADVERLRAFLTRLPEGSRPAFEFRHESWFVPDVYDALRAANAALCASDMEPDAPPPLEATADFGYLRLRQPEYDDQALARWAERVLGMGWSEVYVFFKHEDAGAGPALAARFRERFEAAGGG